MDSAPGEFQNLIGQVVVVDVNAPFVYLGTLKSVSDGYIVLTDADVHDLRDSESTRELYVVSSARDGIRRNRKEVSIQRAAILSMSRIDDVVDY